MDMIVRLLMIIFDRSWQSGEMAEDWRKVNVTPVFRKDKKEDQGASPQSLERWWSFSFCRSSLTTWMTRRWSRVVSMNSLRINNA